MVFDLLFLTLKKRKWSHEMKNEVALEGGKGKERYSLLEPPEKNVSLKTF